MSVTVQVKQIPSNRLDYLYIAAGRVRDNLLLYPNISRSYRLVICSESCKQR